MRERRYRYWNKQAGKYHYDQNQVIEILKQQITGLYDHEKDGCFLEEFTGKRDGAGKRIFEGDLLLLQDREASHGQALKVVWNNDYARYDVVSHGLRGELALGSLNLSKWEVVGNINENKNMLRRDGE